MRAGLLRDRIEVDERVDTQDSTGDPVESWVTRGTVWGAITPLRNREALIASQLLVKADTRIVLRWGPVVEDMTSRWRVRSAGATYNIASIINAGQHGREIELLCSSGTNAG